MPSLIHKQQGAGALASTRHGRKNKQLSELCASPVSPCPRRTKNDVGRNDSSSFTSFQLFLAHWSLWGLAELSIRGESWGKLYNSLCRLGKVLASLGTYQPQRSNLSSQERKERISQGGRAMKWERKAETWQETVKRVPMAKLGQKEQSFECKAGNVNSSLSRARCLPGGHLPSPAGTVVDLASCQSWEPDSWPPRSPLLFLFFHMPWGHFIS